MRAQVSVWTIDGDDLESVTALDSTKVGQWIRVLAGPEGSIGEESFDILVCTPAWIASEVKRVGAVVGRHHLIVAAWDPIRVRELVGSLFTGVEAKDWLELANRLARLGFWEFEDYQPHQLQ
jgi:hypothetical protein